MHHRRGARVDLEVVVESRGQVVRAPPSSVPRAILFATEGDGKEVTTFSALDEVDCRADIGVREDGTEGEVGRNAGNVGVALD